MKTILLSVLSLVLFISANGQSTQTANHNVSLILQDALTIAFTTGGPGQSITFSTPTQYSNGIELTGAAVLAVKSNRAYTLNVKAATANFTLGAGASTLPSTALGVSVGGAATYTGLTTGGQDILTNQPVGENSHTFDYKATPGYFMSGTYVLNVIYTATQL